MKKTINKKVLILTALITVITVIMPFFAVKNTFADYEEIEVINYMPYPYIEESKTKNNVNFKINIDGSINITGNSGNVWTPFILCDNTNFTPKANFTYYLNVLGEDISGNVAYNFNYKNELGNLISEQQVTWQEEYEFQSIELLIPRNRLNLNVTALPILSNAPTTIWNRSIANLVYNAYTQGFNTGMVNSLFNYIFSNENYVTTWKPTQYPNGTTEINQNNRQMNITLRGGTTIDNWLIFEPTESFNIIQNVLVDISISNMNNSFDVDFGYTNSRTVLTGDIADFEEATTSLLGKVIINNDFSANNLDYELPNMSDKYFYLRLGTGIGQALPSNEITIELNVKNEERQLTITQEEVIYNNGYKDGYDNAIKDNNEEYNKGYFDGKEIGTKQGFENGKATGYAQGIAENNPYTFLSLVSAVVDAPIKALTSFFNFDLLGFNMAGLIQALFTLFVILTVLRLILG